MKKVLYIASIIILAACSNDSMEFEQQEVIQQKQLSKNRKVSEAIDIANNAVVQFFDVTRAGGKVVDIDNIEVVTSSATRSGGEGGDTLLYIVNYADNNGFAVVSANRNTEGLLAVTEQGNYDPAVESKNGGFEMFMDMAEEYVATASWELTIPDWQDPTTPQIKEFKEEIDTIMHIVVAPKLDVKWGQTGTEGYYAPNGVAGCANTAAAQIMSYFCYPSQITLTYLGDNARNIYLIWDEIKYHKESHRYPCSATAKAHEAITYLHRELGYRNNSNYITYSDPDLNETVTLESNASIPFTSLGYTTSSYISYNNSDLASFLNEDKLIFMIGSTTPDGTGHAWVIDGGKKSIITTRFYTRTQGSFLWELQSESTNEIEYYHHNWGWYGDCNGYFNKNVLATNGGFDYDNEGQLYNNSYSQNYLYHLKYFWVTR